MAHCSHPPRSLSAHSLHSLWLSHSHLPLIAVRSPRTAQVPRPALRASPCSQLSSVLWSPFRSPLTRHPMLSVHWARVPLPHLGGEPLPTLSSLPLGGSLFLSLWWWPVHCLTTIVHTPLLLSSVAHSSRLTLVAILSPAQSNELSLIFPLALHSWLSSVFGSWDAVRSPSFDRQPFIALLSSHGCRSSPSARRLSQLIGRSPSSLNE